MNLKEATIIDVRTPGEYEMGNVPGSINIPLDTVPTKLDEIKGMKLPLVVCCASGGRSNAACQFLSENGISDLFDGGPWTSVMSQLNN